MAPSTPTGLLVLAMLVGQAAGFARVPKELAEKDGGVLPSRMTYRTGGAICAGPDISEWKDTYGDGCDWYAEHDPGCNFEPDYGQDTNCPVTCNPGCAQTFLCGAGTTMGVATAAIGSGAGIAMSAAASSSSAVASVSSTSGT